jgi:hypothetical protein
MTIVAVTPRTSRVPPRLSRIRCCQPFGFVTVGSGLMVESSLVDEAALFLAGGDVVYLA